MQLVAYGAQDVYLTGNPQITFFKVVYRRHTNFSMEAIEQTFNGTADFGKKVTATISRNGDLVCGMRLQLDITQASAAADYGLGNACIKTADLEIGGQLIDRHYGEWMNIWGELTTPAGKLATWDRMVGNVTSDTDRSTLSTGISTNTGRDAGTINYLNVPFQFWFCRNPGLALPLIALQYHEVKLIVDFQTSANVNLRSSGSGTSAMTTCKLWVDYVYLDTDERRRFAQVSHEYLIEQVQFTGDESITATTSKKIDLHFNHPCKELVWVFQSGAGSMPKLDFGFSTSSGDNEVLVFHNAKLQLNGHDRFAEQEAEYFLDVQPYLHHTRGGRRGGAMGGACKQQIYVYSFALQPEEHQPSGTCNFSRIDNATLTLSRDTALTEAGVVKVFAVNYNVLRIMSGMGGLAYSN